MSSKRLFAALLALCMMISVVAPAAAVEAPANGYEIVDQKIESGTKVEATTSPFKNDLVVSEDNKGVSTLRDNPIDFELEEAPTNEESSGWNLTATDKPDAALEHANALAVRQELTEAMDFFDADEKVCAFVVMEDEPLSMTHSDIRLVSQNAETLKLEKQLIEKQDAMIAAIEKMVLGGKDLEVRYQFTYLTNAFTVNATLSELNAIAEMDGVKTVFVAPTYDAIPSDENDPASPNTVASGEMTGVTKVWEDLGYTGQGTKIAIIDTGLDLDHPSFAADPEGASMTVADIQAVLEDLNIYKRMGGNLSAEDLYRTAKVPFAFNYVDGNLTADHSSDYQGDHGTHVAGIAAANAVEGTDVVGMAPDAQIIVMKVFGANGGAYGDDYIAAIEDAMTLGCDAINLSLGSACGFTTSNTEYDMIFERIASQNVVVTMSAGNDGTSAYGNLWGTDLNRTQNPDTSTVGAPSTYVNGFSIASAQNSVVMGNHFIVGDTKVFYQDTYQALLGYAYLFLDLLEPGDYEYAMVPGVGNEADFYDADGNSIVEGKIAVVSRGDINYGDKVLNAEMAGAVACVVYNNVDEDVFSMYMNIAAGDDPTSPASYLPACMISLADGQAMAAAENKTMTVTYDLAGREDAAGGQMSSFSSWGTTSDLRLVPDITGIGGNVYSCYDGGQYGIMSGTSMSAPQMAGISALVMQYLKDTFPHATDGELHELATALMMSTADPIIDSVTGVEASPRQQGAGLVDAAEAITSGAYLTVGGDRPKAELGDDRYGDGYWVFSFEIHNISDEDLTYTLDGSVLAEAVAGADGEYFVYEHNIALEGAVTFDKTTVTVPAGGKANVKATVTLAEEDIAYFEAYYPNGGFVEGYVYLFDEEGNIALNLPYMGFYGDWTQAPMFDDGWWWENGFWGASDGYGEADQFYHAMWTSLAGQDFVLGLNPYGVTLGEDGNVVYDAKHNSISPNGDGLIDGIDEIYLSLLRAAKNLTFTWSVDGEPVSRYTCINVAKAMYRSNYGQVVPFIHSWYTGTPDFTGLADGSVVNLTVDGRLDYGTGGDNIISIDMTVDMTAPEALYIMEMPQNDGTHMIGVIAEEAVGIAGAFLLNPTGTRIVAEGEVEEFGNGTHIVKFDITGLGDEFQLVMGDYAANESYYEVEYSASENLPVMDTSLLYGYRINDSIIGSYIGYDYMFGWVSMTKPTAEDAYIWVEQETDEHLEYYSLTAAEYAGGYVFATDAANNFLVMRPGLWNRHTICNLGDVSGLDMAFDDTTDTMYLLGKEGSYVSLYSVDLASGALTEVKYYGYQGSAPWVLTAADDGTLYTVKYSNSSSSVCKLYMLDKDNEYAMTPVLNAAGEEVVLVDANGNNLAPNYIQSMTYSQGMIYWAYFYGSSWYGNAANMVTIDTTADFAYIVTDLATNYPSLGGADYSDTEVVGLLTLDETEYQFPNADVLDSIWLDQTELILGVGDMASVTANPIPWNFEITEVTLTSADESIATVEDGMIVGVAEGSTTVTVSAHGATATVKVHVVNIDGSFYAHDYYNGNGDYGDTLLVNLEEMSIEHIRTAPVDFIAGSYNGHDGYFYGYTQGGDFWRYDIETGDCAYVGNSGGVDPADMAYDYSTGFMYAATVDFNTGEGTICAVNMKNGKLVTMASVFAPITLACDMDGNIYYIDAYGDLNKGTFVDGVLESEPIMSGLGELMYLQSMYYSYENDVLVWCYPEGGSLMWVDPEAGYVINLGDPTGSGLVEWTGMFEIPAEIPALPEVAVESLTAESMTMVKGSTKMVDYTVAPLNATCQNVVWTSSNSDVVTVNEDGSLTAVADGAATVTGELVDTIAGKTLTVSIEVEVITAADNLFGHVLGDLYTGGAQYWIGIDPANPGEPAPIMAFDYTLYAEEYYDGKLYAYGFDGNDWESNWQLFVLDPATYEILEQTDLGEGFPFVYDMTYDYSTSTMYAVAGPSSEDTNLYVVNMETGALLPYLTTEQMFMSLAAGADGKLYAIESSISETDYDTYETVSYPANLYTIDPLTKEVELVGNTGVVSNMVASMTYDHDTGYLYWPALAQTDTGYSSGLYIVDPASAEATYLGIIGQAGTQIGGMYVLCDEYPEEVEQLNSLILTPSSTLLAIGETATLDAVTLPMNVGAEVVWTSSDESVATVVDGVVTGHATGSVTITATATLGEITKTTTAKVTVLDQGAGFLSYNITDGGLALINRHDYSLVTQLTAGESAAKINALAYANGIVYGADEQNSFFKLDMETFERTEIATVQVELDADSVFNGYEIVDLDYDAANDRMLALVWKYLYDAEMDEKIEYTYGRVLCEINLETGALTELMNFGESHAVMSIAVAPDGTIYYYWGWDDGIYILDMENREDRMLVSTQTQSVYGDTTLDQSMFYDALTETIYMMTTGNGNFYRMLTVDPVLGTLVRHSDVGEVVDYMGDAFAGMTFVSDLTAAPVEHIVTWKSMTTTLGGDIGMNFYVELSDSLINDPSTFVQFTFGNKIVNVPMANAVDASDKGENVYRFTCPLTAKNMADDVTAQVFCGDVAVGEAKTTSVVTYCNWIIENYTDDKTVNLMKAMLNYGAAAQNLFGYNTDDLANAALSEADKVLADVDASAYAHTKTGEEDGIALVSASLLLDTTTTCRFYFELTGDKAIEEFTFLVNGEEIAPVLADDGRYYVDVVGIAAHNLDVMQVVTVGGLTVEYAGLSYVNQVMSYDKSTEATKDMAKALFAFAMAAEAYID